MKTNNKQQINKPDPEDVKRGKYVAHAPWELEKETEGLNKSAVEASKELEKEALKKK
jgi:hypothetical protein